MTLCTLRFMIQEGKMWAGAQGSVISRRLREGASQAMWQQQPGKWTEERLMVGKISYRIHSGAVKSDFHSSARPKTHQRGQHSSDDLHELFHLVGFVDKASCKAPRRQRSFASRECPLETITLTCGLILRSPSRHFSPPICGIMRSRTTRPIFDCSPRVDLQSLLAV